MKTLVFIAYCALATALALAQGTIEFANGVPWSAPPVDAPFFDSRGDRLAGANYLAQLYAGITAEALQPVDAPIPFLTNGYFNSPKGPYRAAVATFPMASFGGPAWVQVRAWEAAGGPSFEQAAFSGHWTGISEVLFLSRTGHGGVNPTGPVPLVGLKYPGHPVIIREPQNQMVRAGEKANLSVVASGGVAMSYQWHQGQSGDASKPIPGATSASFATPVLTVDTSFWVKVQTSAGSTNSPAALVMVLPASAARLSLRLVSGVPNLSIDGAVGTTYRIEYKPDLAASEWITLDSVSLASNPLTFKDTTATGVEARFYRVVAP